MVEGHTFSLPVLVGVPSLSPEPLWGEQINHRELFCCRHDVGSDHKPVCGSQNYLFYFFPPTIFSFVYFPPSFLSFFVESMVPCRKILFFLM